MPISKRIVVGTGVVVGAVVLAETAHVPELSGCLQASPLECLELEWRDIAREHVPERDHQTPRSRRAVTGYAVSSITPWAALDAWTDWDDDRG